jgi:uncharacterized protein (DUF849 family)
MSTQPERLFETDTPLDEANLNPELVQRILKAAEQSSGPVMTADEFREWLKQT